MTKASETTTLASGCFWCTEAIFKRLKGVQSVISGYTGGTTPDPTYQQVCSGNTGHAEAIQVVFNPLEISFEKILEIFWRTHNPTTLNQQGYDHGTQVRSAIFYHTDQQKAAALYSKSQLEAENLYPDPIVTEISPVSEFYEAEVDHQNYYDQNQRVPYCNVVIDPKIHKLLKDYKQNIKTEYQS